MSKKLTTEEFIEKAKRVHGDRFDYSKVDYKATTIKVIITCKSHGDFEQRPFDHLNNGCSKCSGKYNPTTEEFIEKAKRVHGDRFDYSKTKYIRALENVIITCKIHGDFEQTPDNHLHGKGCLKCKHDALGNMRRRDIKEIIETCTKIHDNKYDYSLIKTYKTNQIKYPIICKKTKEVFYQSMANHLNNKHGCPCCKINLGEKHIEKILKNNNFKYEKQKSFEDCRYKLLLRFDFYISDKNILIEYDGQQHFEPIEYFGGEEKFKIEEIKDDIKNKYCEDNNIVLIRFPYWLSKKDIEEILLNDLNN